MLLGTLAPTSGTLRVLGEAPAEFRRATRERMGYMPQRSILYNDLTVGENVDFAASLFGLLLFRRRKRKRQVLELLDLWRVRDRRAGRLSGGMQRRLSLACALVHDPALLVLDEPTAGIDPILRRTVWDELHRQRDRGVTILATTQYVTEAEECDEVALIATGRVVAFGAPAPAGSGAFASSASVAASSRRWRVSKSVAVASSDTVSAPRRTTNATFEPGFTFEKSGRAETQREVKRLQVGEHRQGLEEPHRGGVGEDLDERAPVAEEAQAFARILQGTVDFGQPAVRNQRALDAVRPLRMAVRQGHAS